MFNYKSAISRCDNDRIKMLLKKIEGYKEYSLLASPSALEYKRFREMFEFAPDEIRSWYKINNGGLLFDTAIFSTMLFDDENGVGVISLSRMNYTETKEMLGMSADMCPFAAASFGDMYCFYNNGSKEIVQWSLTEGRVVARWGSFSIWLNQEINAALELVSRRLLYPLPIYYEFSGVSV